ncbi:MAG: hypothetical protein ACFB0B_16430 [Thermonemataceae bacterium]
MKKETKRKIAQKRQAKKEYQWKALLEGDPSSPADGFYVKKKERSHSVTQRAKYYHGNTPLSLGRSLKTLFFY